MIGKAATSWILKRHYALLERMKASKGGARYRVARKLVKLAPIAAWAWRIQYPDKGLPENPAFTRVGIELERQGDHLGAIAICERAIRSGWREESHQRDDWQRRIARNQRKLLQLNQQGAKP